jgi:HTH-type transcriptional regulator / antitoxin HigA
MPNTTKTSGNVTLAFNPAAYASLLAEALPKKIETEEEYDRVLEDVEELHFNKNKTPEQRALYKLLVLLISAYDDEHHPGPPPPPPHHMLQFIMESSGMSQADLVELGIGSSGVVSEIVNGKRAISKEQAKKLGERFKVSPSLFI